MSDDTMAPEVADELYAGPPAAFVAGRDALVAQARAAGDRELATALKALRRPTVGAWYLNTAARAGTPSLRELLGFGEQLRDAQARGDFARLRELAPRRGSLVAATVRDVARLVAERGATVTPAGLDEVRATLSAALADPAVAGQVAGGRVDRPHAYGGFGELGTATAPGGAVAGHRGPGPGRREQADSDTDTEAEGAVPTGEPDGGDALDAARARRAEQAGRVEARRRLDAAEEALAEAAARRAERESDAAAARAAVDSLAARLEAARHDLAVAEAELAEADAEEAAAGGRVERARTEVQA